MVDGTGIQKVMKVSMRYAARGCIYYRMEITAPMRAGSRDAVHISASSRITQPRDRHVAYRDRTVMREVCAGRPCVDSGGDFNAVVIDG